MKKNYIEKLYDKDDVVAYNYLKELVEESKNNSNLYAYMNEYIDMISNEKSYIQVRGFLLICVNSKYDKNNLINKNINLILGVFDSDKPTVVRQCIKALYDLVQHKKELIDSVLEKIESINISKYKDTVSGLIEEDIKKIKMFINSL